MGHMRPGCVQGTCRRVPAPFGTPCVTVPAEDDLPCGDATKGCEIHQQTLADPGGRGLYWDLSL
ncbi:MAG: hypothetical protein ACQEXJ_10605 [Myxococcota bacterium]